MTTLAAILIIIPLLMTFVTFIVESSFLVSILNVIASGFLALVSLYLSSKIFSGDITEASGLFVFDSLSAFSIRLLAIIVFLVFLYSASYLNSLKAQKEIDDKVFHNYYVFSNLFIAAMYALALLNNITWSWIAVELTTLSSALLLALYRESRYIEAAWKYVIICSVGILLALLGIVFFIISAQASTNIETFNFSNLAVNNLAFDPELLKISFVLIFIGFGTKVGLVPMHTWLPDAYQNSPSPISALLTACLSPLVLIPILRYKHLVDLSLGDASFSNGLFCFFGALSIVMAAIFLVNQSDFKRLIAYSSIENLGLIVLAIGINTRVAVIAAFLHIIYHAFAKLILFFSTGNIFVQYHSHTIADVKNVYSNMKKSAFALTLGIFAILALPPFAIFTSKIMILRELLLSHFTLSIVVLLAFVVIFGSFIHYFNKVLFLKEEQVGIIKSQYRNAKLSLPFVNFISILLPIIILVYFGLFTPIELFHNIEKLAGVLGF